MSFALLRRIARQISTALAPLLQKISWSAHCTAHRAEPSESSLTVMNTSSSDCWSLSIGMSWLDPDLSLERHANMAIDMRQALLLPPEHLRDLVQRLIRDSYHQQQILDCAVRRVMALEIELTLATEQPGIRPPTADHHAMARDLLAKG